MRRGRVRAAIWSNNEVLKESLKQTRRVALYSIGRVDELVDEHGRHDEVVLDFRASDSIHALHDIRQYEKTQTQCIAPDVERGPQVKRQKLSEGSVKGMSGPPELSNTAYLSFASSLVLVCVFLCTLGET